MTTDNNPKIPESKTTPKTIADIYPHLTPKEQAEADYALKRYVALVWRIYQRLRREKQKAEKFDDVSFKR